MKGNIQSDALYLIELDDTIDYNEYTNYLKLLSKQKQNRIKRFKFDIDKKLSIVADLFLRYLICSYFNVKNSELKFDINKYGKPYLLGVEGFCYNISHTKSAIVIAVSKYPIGVDIEKIKNFPKNLPKRFFCKQEIEYIENAGEDDIINFYEVWTKKEAYVKWRGEGLSISLDTFDVFNDEIYENLVSFLKGEYMVSVCKKKSGMMNVYLNYDEKEVYQKIREIVHS